MYFLRLNCYSYKNLISLKRALKKLQVRNAIISELYLRADKYFLLSEKRINEKLFIKNEYIKSILSEHATLISKNALKEVYELL
jgi:negative regulator of genetic competence, sporulation and motility